MATTNASTGGGRLGSNMARGRTRPGCGYASCLRRRANDTHFRGTAFALRATAPCAHGEPGTLGTIAQHVAPHCARLLGPDAWTVLRSSSPGLAISIRPTNDGTRDCGAVAIRGRGAARPGAPLPPDNLAGAARHGQRHDLAWCRGSHSTRGRGGPTRVANRLRQLFRPATMCYLANARPRSAMTGASVSSVHARQQNTSCR